MKSILQKRLVVLGLIVAVTSVAGADTHPVEMKGQITELDAIVDAVRVQDATNSTLFALPEDTLMRYRLTRLTFENLHVGDQVEVRYWPDNLKVEKLDVLE